MAAIQLNTLTVILQSSHNFLSTWILKKEVSGVEDSWTPLLHKSCRLCDGGVDVDKYDHQKIEYGSNDAQNS